MKITEKIYIERLSDMIEKHTGDVCNHCPMMKGYAMGSVMISTDSRGNNSCYNGHIACEICRKITKRYSDVNPISIFVCPCGYFRKLASKEGQQSYQYDQAKKIIKRWKISRYIPVIRLLRYLRWRG